MNSIAYLYRFFHTFRKLITKEINGPNGPGPNGANEETKWDQMDLVPIEQKYKKFINKSIDFKKKLWYKI